MYSFTYTVSPLIFCIGLKKELSTEPSFPAECGNRLPSDEIIATELYSYIHARIFLYI